MAPIERKSGGGQSRRRRNGPARFAADESSAVSAVRTIKAAESSYQPAYPNVGYSTNLDQLGPVDAGAISPAGGPAQASVLSNAAPTATAKSGFYCGEVGVAGTGGRLKLTYRMGSAPAAFNQTGGRTFCSAEG